MEEAPVEAVPLRMAVPDFSVHAARRRSLVFQFIGTDSMNLHPVSDTVYDGRGRVIYYHTKDYKECLQCGTNEHACARYYQAGRLVMQACSQPDSGDSSLTVFLYDSAGRMTRQKDFDYTRRLKKGVDKGWGRPGGCVVFDSDFEQEKSWAKRNESIFQYGKKNGSRQVTDVCSQPSFTGARHVMGYDRRNRW